MWFLPSRERPTSLRRFFDAFRETRGSTPGVVLLDNDDPCILEYRDIELPDNWCAHIDKRMQLGSRLNDAFKLFPVEPWYGLMADDLLPMTDRWDERLVAVAGPVKVAFGDDGINGPDLATHPVLGGEFIRSLGWIAYPGLSRIYIDTVLTDIARARGVLRYVPDVKTEHLHFSVGKSPMDAVYEKPEAAMDWEIYERWRLECST